MDGATKLCHSFFHYRILKNKIFGTPFSHYGIGPLSIDNGGVRGKPIHCQPEMAATDGDDVDDAPRFLPFIHKLIIVSVLIIHAWQSQPNADKRRVHEVI